MADMFKRQVGQYVYIYPLMFIPKKELHLYFYYHQHKYAVHSYPNAWSSIRRTVIIITIWRISYRLFSLAWKIICMKRIPGSLKRKKPLVFYTLCKLRISHLTAGLCSSQ